MLQSCAAFDSSASPLLGTSRSLFFSKASGDASYYLPVSSGTVLALRLRAGAVVGVTLRLSTMTKPEKPDCVAIFK